MKRRALKIKCTPSPDGYYPWVLVQTEFSKSWVSAFEIIGEAREPLDRHSECVHYAEQAMLQYNRSQR
jgi:hypothetical protein